MVDDDGWGADRRPRPQELMATALERAAEGADRDRAARDLAEEADGDVDALAWAYGRAAALAGELEHDPTARDVLGAVGRALRLAEEDPE